MGVMEEPTPVEDRDGTLLSTRSVFGWRFRESKWKRRCRFVAREFKGGMVGDASTFAPTSSMASVRLVLVLHVVFRWSLSVLDVKDAFLLVPQQELVLVDKPDWWSDEHQGRRWVLGRRLPGQRNAASRWFDFLKEKLVNLGFVASEIQPSLFRHRDRPLVICSPVDDSLLSGVEVQLQWCHGEFKKLFTVERFRSFIRTLTLKKPFDSLSGGTSLRRTVLWSSLTFRSNFDWDVPDGKSQSQASSRGIKS